MPQLKECGASHVDGRQAEMYLHMTVSMFINSHLHISDGLTNVMLVSAKQAP